MKWATENAANFFQKAGTVYSLWIGFLIAPYIVCVILGVDVTHALLFDVALVAGAFALFVLAIAANLYRRTGKIPAIEKLLALLRRLNSIEIKDYSWVFIAMLLGCSISIIVFGLELTTDAKGLIFMWAINSILVIAAKIRDIRQQGRSVVKGSA